MSLKKGPLPQEVKAELQHMIKELESLYQDRAMYWRQRGKAAWMKDGDKNISYFHARASTRERINTTKGL